MPQFEAEAGSKTVGWARYENGVLEVDFKNYKTGAKQSTYRYDGTRLADLQNPYGKFPEEVWDAFSAAPNKAQYFANHIRNTYKGVRL